MEQIFDVFDKIISVIPDVQAFLLGAVDTFADVLEWTASLGIFTSMLTVFITLSSLAVVRWLT